MSTENITIDGNKLIRHIGVDDVGIILDLMGVNLATLRDLDVTHADACEWHCGVEGKWWPIEAYQLNLTDEYAVRWTTTDEAGIDDVEIIEVTDAATDADELRAWLHDIAANCGSCDGRVR